MAVDYKCKNCGCKIDTGYLKIGDILECEKCKYDKDVLGLENTIGEEPKGRGIPKVIAALIPIGMLSLSIFWRLPFDKFLYGLFRSYFESIPEYQGIIILLLGHMPGTIVINYFYVKGVFTFLIGFGPEKVKFNPKPIRKALLQGVIAMCLFEVLLYIFR